MKKALKLFVAVAVCASLFTACKKEVLEGQYMPDKKLSSVRSADIRVVDGVETESFVTVYNYVWEGDLLSSITTISEQSGEYMSKLSYEYDSKNRVEKVDCEGVNHEVYKFIYNDKELVKVEEYYESDEVTSEYLFTKADGKLSQITLINYIDFKRASFNSLHLLFPEQIANAMEMASKDIKADTTVSLLTWEGDNIVKTELISSAHTVNEYTYDDKTNPVKGLFTKSFFMNSEDIYSANNILVNTYSLPMLTGTINMERTNTYEYDGDYPTRVVSILSSDSPLLPETKKITTYTYLP